MIVERDEPLIFKGRVKSKRDVSSKLIFYDLVQNGDKLQAVYNYKTIGGDAKEFNDKVLSLSVGDIVSEYCHLQNMPGLRWC